MDHDRIQEIPQHLRVAPIEISPATVIAWTKPEPISPLEERCLAELEPGDYEIYDQKLANYLDEAREIFIRSGVSGMLRSGDLIVALYTANGDLASASAGTYLHCVTAVLPIKFVLHTYLAETTVGINEGDIFYASEARYGGIHNPDQMAFMPVFHDGELIAWTAALAHQPETGAIEPGGMPVTARTRDDEGMKLTPIKIGENYRIRRDLLDMIVNFISRAPRMQAIDTRARVTGADRLRIRMQQLSHERGNDFVRGLMRQLVVKSEKAARQRVAQWNDGIYRTVAFTDTIGRETALIRAAVTAIKKGDTITFDFTGTSPENDSSYNCFPHIVVAHAAIFIYGYAFHDLPVSNGTLAVFDWIIPEGTIFNASPNAAISNSPSLNCLTLGVVPKILATMIYDSDSRDLIGACNGNTCGPIGLAGPNQYGIPVAEVDAASLNTEGQGARFDMDGVDAYGFPWAHAGRSPDVEETETEYQVMRLFFRLRRDNCGFGAWRGGAGSEVALVPRHVPAMRWNQRSRNAKITCALGLFGGYPSSSCIGIGVKETDLWEKMARGDNDLPAGSLDLATERTVAGQYLFEHPSRSGRIGRSGDIIVHLAGGGGGYGDVLRRDPHRVLEDLEAGLISDWTVRNVYCVRYDPETLEIDEGATSVARAAERGERLQRGKPWAEFMAEWSAQRPPDEALAHFGSWPEGKPDDDRAQDWL
jgi:acetophenone carboxylase